MISHVFFFRSAMWNDKLPSALTVAMNAEFPSEVIENSALERIEFIDAMPYTGAQKLDKRSLQADIEKKLQAVK